MFRRIKEFFEKEAEEYRNPTLSRRYELEARAQGIGKKLMLGFGICGLLVLIGSFVLKDKPLRNALITGSAMSLTISPINYYTCDRRQRRYLELAKQAEEIAEEIEKERAKYDYINN